MKPLSRAQPSSLASLESALDPLRETLARRAAAAAMIPLGSATYPDSVALAASRSAAEGTLRQGILELLASLDKPSADSPGEIPPDGRTRGLSSRRLAPSAALPPLLLPPPEELSALPASRLALVAAGGALGGMCVGALLARLLFATPDPGVVPGALVGAWSAVRGILALDDAPGIRRLLALALGVGTLAEGWGLLAGGWPFGSLWRLLGGRHAGFRRLGLHLLLAGILLVTRRSRRFSSAAYERTLKACALQWLEGALRGLAFAEQEAFFRRSNKAQGLVTSEERALLALAEEVRCRKNTSPEALSRAWEDLQHELEAQGVRGDENPPERWTKGMEERYETFGRLEPGDPIRIERMPLFFEGTLRRRGLVRKDRHAS